ncbi:MAG: hypothetical protein EXR55_00030 [Dehalococcoidia bacterium]|nr:hypothetical protein [Dehalococcoidia bacterium]
MGLSDEIVGAAQEELRKYPSSVGEEFQRAVRMMEETVPPAQLEEWVKEGLSLTRLTVRSWEAASEFFRVSPTVVRGRSYTTFQEWTRWGNVLCQDSPTMAVAYFRASPGVVDEIDAEHIPTWASVGRGLYKGTWKSTALAGRFFEASPGLLRSLSFQELLRFTKIIDMLSHRSYDLAVECIGLARDTFPRLSGDRDAFISLLSALGEGNWRQVKGAFEVGSRALQKVERVQGPRFLRLAQKVAQADTADLPAFLTEASDALGELDRHTHATVLGMAEVLVDLAPGTVVEFIKSCPIVLRRINDQQLALWFREGIRLLRETEDGGMAYFKVESAHSEEMLDLISSGVELDRVKDILRLYCLALAGIEMDIAVTQELVGKDIGWVSKAHATTEGTTVFLPPVVDQYPTKEENFTWYKVVSTHQVAHLEFGSFDFRFDRPATLFEDLRLSLAPVERKPKGPGAAAGNGSQATKDQQAWITDVSHFFDLFEDRKLILDIFTVVEDARLDYLVKADYPGIRDSYRKVQQGALKARPSVEGLPAREALMEFLVQWSLGAEEGLMVPQEYAEEVRALARIASTLLAPRARVEDTAEAALRIYEVLSRIPNREADDWEEVEAGGEDAEGAEPPKEMNESGAGASPPEAQPRDEQAYRSPQDVDYRGDFKPELTQLLAQLRMLQEQANLPGAAPPQGLGKEQLEELLARSAELEIPTADGQIPMGAGLFANNLLREAGVSNPQSPDYPSHLFVHSDEEHGALEVTEPQTYLYDEWDFRAGDYKPRWCMVREKALPEGEVTFYQTTLQNYAGLISRVQRQFELVLPEAFRKIKRLPDGEEFDLDAVIEAIVDRRVGSSPSDKLYWRRNKVIRDVAVVFLLDMSASTAEAIEDHRRRAEDWDAPEDPGEYMVWLRARRAQGLRRSYKRIIDVEKESTVLLIRALETIGDTYGIYGFSGYGRENVEFFVIKDILEPFGERIMRRIDKIAPLHATRMGPAIRHATRKLARLDAKTKILFLISDGRPQDRGYSREGVEKEYAVHDTKMAMAEARRMDITPFCLTVDRSGHDYLKTMMSDMGYEVLDDITQLPERLPYLYRKLTV